MLWLVAALYGLLALRIRVHLEAVVGKRTSLALTVCASAIQLRYDGEILCGAGGGMLQLSPRYGPRGRIKGIHRAGLNGARPYLRAVMRAGHFESIVLRACVGLDDAYETALAAGALRALCAALLSRLCRGAAIRLEIAPEFSGASLAAYGRCIFSCQLGDMMFAAIKSAVKKMGRGIRGEKHPA